MDGNRSTDAGGANLRRVLRRGVMHVVLVAACLSMVVPFYWMVANSLMDYGQTQSWPPPLVPNPATVANYVGLVTGPIGRQFPLWFLNSIRISVAVVVGQLLTCSLAGYTFARIRFPGRDALFLVYMSTMMVPGVVYLIPLFQMMTKYDLVNTHWSLILPGLASAGGTFLFRQFFLTMPAELQDAAEIDGASPFRIFRQVFLPLAKPALATQGIFTFLGTWNAFLGPLIFLQRLESRTITVGIRMIQWQHSGIEKTPVVLAGATISVLPIFIIFILGQRYFVQGIALSGIKG